MSGDWWKTPYPTNPSPPAVQQPRCLYPPDIGGGYEPSSDGPDVRAYKIAVHRLGRWDKNPSGFDQDYSNRFAHGEPGEHVPTTGIAGVQRQSKLDGTGNLGRNVFDILRCALVPDGLPCAGEPAFNEEALSLLNGTKWWKYPYAIGPGPKGGSVKFPRSLYAPDWTGEPTPSPGPDVEAHKRAVSRLGRWPWQTFNESYTNEFAHGKSGNVGDTGIAGFQRQTPGLDDTGNLSAKAYERLMRSLVPPCLPHANEYGYDGRALELLKQANAKPSGGSTRERAIKAATAEIGTKESPAGSNCNKYGKWYGMDAVPWCAIFCTWCYLVGAGGSPSFVKGSYYAYVPYIVSDARNGRRGLSVTSTPAPGDLVCYDWQRDGTFDHVGLFKSGSSYEWKAIEGNTSTSNQSNGGQVMERTRNTGQAAVVFVRVAQ